MTELTIRLNFVFLYGIMGFLVLQGQKLSWIKSLASFYFMANKERYNNEECICGSCL